MQGTSAERPTGLPSQLKWTFNFDAGWGTFGFANSLFNNPKEPGVDENLSDQWFEGYVKPALSATYTLASESEIYGKLSAVGERTYGSVPDAFGQDVSSFGPEDLYIGWRSGNGVDDRRERPWTSRRAVAIPARSRVPPLRRRRRRRQPGRLLDQREKGVRVRRDRASEAGAATFEAFYLDKDELEESDSGSRLWGTNFEYSIGRATRRLAPRT